MLGLFLGTLCAVGLVAAVRHRHGFRHCAYGGFYRGFAGWDGPPRSFRRGLGGWGGRQVLRGLFVHLDTTPGQEKAIASSLYEARERLSELRTELRTLPQDLAALLGSDVLDVAALEATLSRQQVGFDRVRAELVRTLASIHEALDTRQRRELGELLADGSLGQLLRGSRARW
jgi:Spy/CpxP family protein refolding chaperone